MQVGLGPPRYPLRLDIIGIWYPGTLVLCLLKPIRTVPTILPP